MMKSIQMAAFAALGFAGFVSAGETAHIGSEDNPYVIDVSTSYEHELFKHDDMGSTVHIRLENIPPAHRSKYRYSFGYQVSRIQPFTKPEYNEKDIKIANLDKGIPIIFSSEESCEDRLSELSDELFADSVTSNQVPVILGKIKAVSNCKEQTTKLEDATKIKLSARLEKGMVLKFTLDYVEGDKETKIAKLTFKERKKEWVTHTGWTFINSRDRGYFSEKNDDDSFTIRQQHNNPDYNHALSMMYSYPMFDNFKNKFLDGVTIGPSGLLGLGQNGLLVGAGISVMITENFVINISGVASEFERLNGVYSVGQNIGDKAIDSSGLTEDKIMHSWALTVGFRFE
jgi:hypothetical protein